MAAECCRNFFERYLKTLCSRNISFLTISTFVGDALKQYYFPILVPIGIIGNVLSFLVRFFLRGSGIKESVIHILKTRMHSSRMRTARLLTVSHSIPCILRRGDLLNPSCRQTCESDPPGSRPRPDADPLVM